VANDLRSHDVDNRQFPEAGEEGIATLLVLLAATAAHAQTPTNDADSALGELLQLSGASARGGDRRERVRGRAGHRNAATTGRALDPLVPPKRG